jgi:multidrug efflux system membrane fusion protein
VDLSFKVGGYVRDVAELKLPGGGKRRLQEGDWVKKGDVLTAVKQDDYASRVAAAQASVDEAVASEKQAKLDYDRLSKLLASKTVPQAEVDNAKAKLDVATARVLAGRARVGETSVSLADTTLKAPLDGVILRRNVEPGQLAAPGQVAFTIADTRTMKVVFGAPDSLVPKLKMDDPVAIRLEAIGLDTTGRISRIAPSADVKSRVFDVQASIPNEQDLVTVGMIASLQMPEASAAPSALALPLTAVVRSPKDPRGFAVFVVDGSGGHETARVREVALGDVTGNAVLVTEGLRTGERVVQTGTALLRDNQPVCVVR